MVIYILYFFSFLAAKENPLLLIDLNNDNINEAISFASSDENGDELSIYKTTKNAQLVKIYSSKLYSKGQFSYLEKIRLMNYSRKFNILFLYYNQGFTQGLGYRRSGICFFTLIPLNEEIKISQIFAGPSYFEEKEIEDYHYSNKRMRKIKLVDIDGDGAQEIIFGFSGSEIIYKWINKKNWKQIQ